MRLKFDFNNGTPSVDFHADTFGATPVELLVPYGVKQDYRQRSIQAYVRAIDYLCRGVANYSSGDLANVSLENNWFGKMEKNGDSVLWNAISDRTFVVVYDMTIDSLTEHMYVADAIKLGRKKSQDDIEPIWLDTLVSPSQHIDDLRNKAINAISIVTEFISGYSLRWGHNGKEGLFVFDSKKKLVPIVEDITDDETYILVKLLILLISKGLHQGIFLIDGRGFSDSVLNGFVETAKLFYGDTFVFVYNLPTNSKLKRHTVTLPNFLLK